MLPVLLGAPAYTAKVPQSMPQQKKLVDLIQQCTSRERDRRPSAKTVVRELKLIFESVEVCMNE